MSLVDSLQQDQTAGQVTISSGSRLGTGQFADCQQPSAVSIGKSGHSISKRILLLDNEVFIVRAVGQRGIPLHPRLEACFDCRGP